MVTQTYELNLIPGGNIVNVHVSQYDEGRTITFDLLNGSVPFTPPSGTTASVDGTKPDKTGFSIDATVSGGTVSFKTAEAICNVAGQTICEVRLRQGTNDIGTQNFILDVERAGYANRATPLGITIVSAPTKTSYDAGDTLNLSGLHVSAAWSDGTNSDVTSSCVTSPANGAVLTKNDTAVIITWSYGGTQYTAVQAITVTVPLAPVNIYISNAPTRIVYTEGDRLDLSGMIVKARWNDETETDVTNAVSSTPANGTILTTSDTSVSIAWIYNGRTFTTTQNITVSEIPVPSRIYVYAAPTKIAYTEGNTLDITGMIVRASWTDGTVTDVTSEITTVPANGAVLTTSDTSIAISWVYNGITYSTTQAITVSELPVPSNIYVYSRPTKIAYVEGDALNLSGMVIKAVWSDETETTVTSEVTTVPANGAILSTSNTKITISWVYNSVTYTTTQNITVAEAARPTGISVSTPPTTTVYYETNRLDLSGMIVQANWNDGTVTTITNSVSTSPADGAILTTSDTSVLISWTYKGLTYTTTQAITVNSLSGAIFGAEWDGTSSTSWTRTDAAALFDDPVPAISTGTGSSPFDNIPPWSGMERVTDAVGGEMVKIPKFYYKLIANGNKLKVQISAAPFTGAYVSPAHIDRGDGHGVRDIVYVGRYLSAVASQGQAPAKSVPNGAPATSTYSSRATCRTLAHNLGAEYWQYDFAMHFTLWLLYIVEFADWDSQRKIGYGGGNNSSTEYTGKSDVMNYHTGTPKTSRATYGVGVQYRNIEDLWSNAGYFLDGCRNTSNGLYIITNPANFSDSANGTLAGKIYNGSQATYPSSFMICDVSNAYPIFIPKGGSGTGENQYTTDRWYQSPSSEVDTYPCFIGGASCYQDLTYGFFAISSEKISGHSIYRGYAGMRIMKLPN